MVSRRRRTLLRAAEVALALLALPELAAADWFAGLEAGMEYDDNLSRSELSTDVVSDRALRLLVEGGRAFELEAGRALTLTSDLRLTAFDEITGMANRVARIEGSFRRKFGLGARVPVLRLSAAVERLDFDDAKRDGWLYAVEIAGSKRLGERWDLGVELSYEVRRADAATPATVFDQERIGASLLADVALGGPWFLGIGYGFLDGDVVSNATPNDRIIAAKEASIPDPVFGEGRLVYRLEADVHRFTVDLGRALTRDSSLLLGYELQATRAHGGIDYERNDVRLTYVHAF